MAEKLKLVLAALMVVAGILVFSYVGGENAAVSVVIMRSAALLVALVIALVLFFTTAVGKATWEFIQGARQEMRKVVWPNRKETTQLTLVVFVMAVLVAIFLFLVDKTLFWIINTKLLGWAG